MSNAATVKKSRDKAGLKSTSVYLTDEQKARWKQVASVRGVSMADALMLGLDALEGRALTRAELLAEIERRLK